MISDILENKTTDLEDEQFRHKKLLFPITKMKMMDKRKP